MAVPFPRSIDERRLRSTKRLEALTQEVEKIDGLSNLRGICIYATGSYGRFEASDQSDLDLFLIDAGSDNDALGRVAGLELLAGLVRCCRHQGFPEFSNDGEFLTVHRLDHIIGELGSPKDDYYNYFTARLLLLLESAVVSNSTAYNAAIDKLVGTYFRDYHDHEKAFEPVFFVNDIIRFWRTLCLNYEHSRSRRGTGAPIDPLVRAKAHLKNLKLKFSRMLICYSMIVGMLASEARSQDDVVRLVHFRPLERLQDACQRRPSLEAKVGSLFDLYAWFLDWTGRPANIVLSDISRQSERDEVFAKARAFAVAMSEIVLEAAPNKEKLRYIVL